MVREALEVSGDRNTHGMREVRMNVRRIEVIDNTIAEVLRRRRRRNPFGSALDRADRRRSCYGDSWPH
jgi:hypothetical protein